MTFRDQNRPYERLSEPTFRPSATLPSLLSRSFCVRKCIRVENRAQIPNLRNQPYGGPKLTFPRSPIARPGGANNDDQHSVAKKCKKVQVKSNIKARVDRQTERQKTISEKCKLEHPKMASYSLGERATKQLQLQGERETKVNIVPMLYIDLRTPVGQ